MANKQSILISGLSQIATNYEILLCDIWGVVHNGVEAFEQACHALCEFRMSHGRVALITNAPRPSTKILNQLLELGVPNEAFDVVVSSGDVTREFLAKYPNKKIFHLGPKRDLGLFSNLEIKFVADIEAELLVCTGLFDDTSETPEDYRDTLKKLVERNIRFICANPDITVIRGEKMIWCAGALAKLYQQLGGVVDIVGKPYKPIYDLALTKLGRLKKKTISKKSVLAIGDGLPTDILGANSNKIDVLFISGGIHSKEFGPSESPNESLVASRLKEEGYKVTAVIPSLVW